MSPDYTGFKSEIYEVETLALCKQEYCVSMIDLLPIAVTCYRSAVFPALISW
jgi:hypothetical protein